MDKRTIIALILIAVIFVGSYFVMTLLSPKPQTVPSTAAGPTPATPPPAEKKPPVTAVPFPKDIAEETAVLRSKIYTVTLSNKGAVVTSILLNDPAKDPENRSTKGDIEMVFASRADHGGEASTAVEYPFELRFGDHKAQSARDLFRMTKRDGAVEFSRVYAMTVTVKNEKGEDTESVKRVLVKKTFSLDDDTYQIKMQLTLENESKEAIPFDFNGVLYTLAIGPQIGPEFRDAKPDNMSDYRKFFILTNGGRKEFGLPAQPEIVTDPFSWAAINGKYYGLIASTDATIKNLVLDASNGQLPFQRSALYFERKREITQALTDEYTFFIGPKKREVLDSFKDKRYGELMPLDIFGYIAEGLKYPLDFFGLIGNYGVAIILLTLLIKILLYPLTRKSFDSMQKMQAVNPKLQELRDKYKDNPRRMNEEMAALYKREGISPLGGCLPQLLQLPILFGLYSLFNTHFALKNAVFIPGWIDDLSVPDFIFRFPGGPVTIPLLITSFTCAGISLLPFIMLGTQLLSTFITQGKSQSADNRMKYLPYILMAVFFFFLYNQSAGLVLYWTVQNILTVIQMLIQKFIYEKKKAMHPAL